LDNPETGENRLMCNRRFQTRRAAGSVLPNDSCRVRPGGARRDGGLHQGATYGSAMRGFSLIEIILVVVLIGGIVAFAASRILGGGDRAKANLARAQVQTLAEKVQQYEMDTGTLPGSLDALVANPGNATGWLGPYAKPVELRDPWNHPYEYRVPGDGQAFDLISLGKDGQAGGESVDGDVKYQ
jgi:general secretion pathway protein G